MSNESTNYEVIARKWRPQKFDEIIGQDHVSQTLRNALKSGRLHHSILLTGPRGTGKTSTARVLAKSLRCPQAVDFVPCNTCTECTEISQGRSLNVAEIDGASNNGVDAIRELRDTVGYMPSSGTYKVYIIDEVHMLSTSAFNALLKTLEEPPSHVIFVMATTEVHKIPNTILSRSQRFDFRRIPTTSIVEHLKTICSSENVKAEDAALWAIAKAGDGSMRDSQSLLDQMITFSGEELSFNNTTEVLGLTNRELLVQCLKSFVSQDIGLTLDAIEKITLSGADPKVFINDLLQEVRHLLVLKIAPNSKVELVDLADGEKNELIELSKQISEADLQMLFDMCLKGAGDLTRASDQKTVLEMILLRMTRVSRIQDVLNLIGNAPTPVAASVNQPAPIKSSAAPNLSSVKTPSSPNSQTRAQVAQTPTPPPVKPETHGPAAQPEESLQFDPNGDLASQWHQLVKKIASLNPLLAASLENISLKAVKGDQLQLSVSEKKKFIFDKANDKDFKKKLSHYFLSFWGKTLSYVVELEESKEEGKADQLSPRELAAANEAKRTSALKTAVTNHPLVKETQSIFNAKIKSMKEIKS